MVAITAATAASTIAAAVVVAAADAVKNTPIAKALLATRNLLPLGLSFSSFCTPLWRGRSSGPM